jgi:threonine aldolase
MAAAIGLALVLISIRGRRSVWCTPIQPGKSEETMTELDPKVVFKECTRFLLRHLPSASQPDSVLNEISQALGPEDRLDFYGEGGLVADFEKHVARLLGKEAAVFMPSGTMAQQIALRVWTERRGCRNVVFHPLCHLERHEEKAYERLHGLRAILSGTPDHPDALIRRATLESIAEPIGAVLIELPQGWLGGVLLPWEELVDLSAWARERTLPLHLDGARLWECTPYYQKDHAQIAELFDSVYVSFYKGLGALAGAMLAGPASLVAEARVWRKRHGGALFKMYPYVLSARRALETRLPRMRRYHELAVAIAKELSAIDGIALVPDPPHTNMMHLYLRGSSHGLQLAALEVAQETRVWMFDRTWTSPLPGQALVEFTVGDATLELSPQEVGELFRKLMCRAAAAV